MFADESAKHVNDLIAWFEEKIKAMPILEIAKADYEYGVPALTGEWKDLAREAFSEWLYNRNYKFSVDQMSFALFRAAKKVDKLNVY